MVGFQTYNPPTSQKSRNLVTRAVSVKTGLVDPWFVGLLCLCCLSLGLVCG